MDSEQKDDRQLAKPLTFGIFQKNNQDFELELKKFFFKLIENYIKIGIGSEVK